MIPALADRILVCSYSDTDAYTLEYCDWYSADQLSHLHFSASEFINDQLNEFYAEFSEWFNLAEYPDIAEQFEPSEVAVFLTAAGAPSDTDFRAIGDYDSFSGL